MKRMVENSEKIEELADVIEIKNGNLVTSYITTPNGTKINIYDNSMYEFGGDDSGSLSIINLGTALLILGIINATKPSQDYWILTLHMPYDKVYADTISTGEECLCSKEEYGNSTKIILSFNKALANPQKSTYKYSFVIGYDGGQLWNV